ncbi:BC85_0335 family putative methyltransferase [Metamycoplasma hominis]|uniref:BC85_0335 family putative methyltransferase n=1 Tax=Metamycoplasma hominis TaxID=2098 RepID=UPI000DDCF3B7|nr:hypothetical protein [Metamycoplasma hominis]RBI34310.1 hypothetical protein DRZ74_00745 [Metamycoplasma hominis]
MKHKGSIFSANTKLGLIISVVVVFILMCVILLITILARRHFLKSTITSSEERELQNLKTKNPNYGIVLSGIKKYYDNVLGDHLIAFLINTIYLNNFLNVSLIEKNDYASISIAALSMANVYSKNQYLIQKQGSNIQNENQDLDLFRLNYADEIYNPSDMIISLCDDLSIEQQINSNLPYLSDRGMLIVSFKTIKDFKNQKNVILDNNLRYETVKISNKNVILLAKNNMNSNNENSKEQQ